MGREWGFERHQGKAAPKGQELQTVIKRVFKLFGIGYIHSFHQLYHSYSIFNTAVTLLFYFFICKNILFGVKLKKAIRISREI